MKNKNKEDCEQLLVDVKALAKRYSVSTRMIYIWSNEGKIPRVKIASRCVRFPVQECDKIIMNGNI